jgi:hypothetical protein
MDAFGELKAKFPVLGCFHGDPTRLVQELSLLLDDNGHYPASAPCGQCGRLTTSFHVLLPGALCTGCCCNADLRWKFKLVSQDAAQQLYRVHRRDLHAVPHVLGYESASTYGTQRRVYAYLKRDVFRALSMSKNVKLINEFHAESVDPENEDERVRAPDPDPDHLYPEMALVWLRHPFDLKYFGLLAVAGALPPTVQVPQQQAFKVVVGHETLQVMNGGSRAARRSFYRKVGLQKNCEVCQVDFFEGKDNAKCKSCRAAATMNPAAVLVPDAHSLVCFVCENTYSVPRTAFSPAERRKSKPECKMCRANKVWRCCTCQRMKEESAFSKTAFKNRKRRVNIKCLRCQE